MISIIIGISVSIPRRIPHILWSLEHSSSLESTGGRTSETFRRWEEKAVSTVGKCSSRIMNALRDDSSISTINRTSLINFCFFDCASKLYLRQIKNCRDIIHDSITHRLTLVQLRTNIVTYLGYGQPVKSSSITFTLTAVYSLQASDNRIYRHIYVYVYSSIYGDHDMVLIARVVI